MGFDRFARTKKVDISFGGGPRGKKNTDFGGSLRFKSLFCQPAPTNPTKLAGEVYLAVLLHPTKFQAKLLTGHFYL